MSIKTLSPTAQKHSQTVKKIRCAPRKISKSKKSKVHYAMASTKQGRSRGWVFTQHTTPGNNEWDPNAIDWSEVRPKVEWIVCGLEETTSGGLHWQGSVHFVHPVSLPGCKEALQSRSVHVERQRGTCKEAVEYCTKTDSGVCYDVDTTEGDVVHRKIIFSWPQEVDDLLLATDTEQSMCKRDAIYAAAMEMATPDEACEFIRGNSPRDWCLYGAQIQRNILSYYARRAMEPRTPKSYSRPFYGGSLRERSHVLLGAPGTGKTNFALDHFAFPLLIRHIDNLKEITCQTDGLVFDDLSFHRWSAQNVIHLVDLAFNSTINVKYGTVTIPAGMPRFFTCNRKFDDWIPEGASDDEREAIRRRCIILNVQANLFNDNKD